MGAGKLYIWGWWQGNNLGDNWIKRTMSSLFPTALFVDTSVQSFDDNSFVICGGGGLFIYDVISPWEAIGDSIAYGMMGIGAEFEHNTLNAVKVFNNSKFFYVRDEYSLKCMHLGDIEKSYDITFAQPLCWTEEKSVNYNKVFFVWRDGHELVNNRKFYDYIKPCDNDVYQEWKREIKKRFESVIEDDFQTKDDNIEERVGDCGFVISGRYHGIVAAIQMGLPFIAIDICPKIRALLEECELDEYCIKLSEYEKLDALIDKSINEISIIREREKAFCKRAKKVLISQIDIAKIEIMKTLFPLNIIHYGSYWMKDNDVVYTMADDLGDMCNLTKIDLEVYTEHPSNRIESNMNTPNGKLCKLNRRAVMDDISDYSANAIILNSGGLYIDDLTVEDVKKRNVVTVGISLSDPDVFPYNGRIYSDRFDLFYTNSKYSLVNDYPSVSVNARILPFAASMKHHYFIPEIERKYDVVIVAHARPDRIQTVENLGKICKLGTFGSGWEHSLGEVNGKSQVEAINSGTMYLSFARTIAGFDNVKVGLFEAMACNQVVITSYMEELKDYFEIGTEILCYKNEDELFSIVEYYLKHEDERERIRKKGYERFIREHTYHKRWNLVLKDIYRRLQVEL